MLPEVRAIIAPVVVVPDGAHPVGPTARVITQRVELHLDVVAVHHRDPDHDEHQRDQVGAEPPGVAVGGRSCRSQPPNSDSTISSEQTAISGDKEN